jgi:methanogenic corrinoid protein MtbC1
VSAVTEEVVARYLERARAADHPGAARLALDLLDQGVPVDDVLEDLVGAAQRETGLRWYKGEWSVVDEHLVTTTSVAVTDAVSAAARHRGGAGHLAVVSAEGDWHALPGRLFAEAMRARGWAVDYLGASTPADHVGEFLGRRLPDALAISCAVPLFYVGAARLAGVAHDNGVPVLIGGAAIAGSRRRALALGADATALAPSGADAVLRQFQGRPSCREPVTLDPSALALDASAEEFADAALAHLGHAFPALRDYDSRQLARTHEDLAYSVRFVAAALLVQDPTVWSDFAAWQVELLRARGVPAVAFVEGMQALADQVEPVSAEGASLLDSVGSTGR